MEEILSGWRKRIDALSDERFEALIVAYMAWFDEGLITEPGKPYREQWTNFMLEADPVFTDDGLAAFVEMYVPK